MEIKNIISYEMDQNCYLITENGYGILIDPGIDTIKILKETEDITINYILLTHCHFDHLYSLNEIAKGEKSIRENLRILSLTFVRLFSLKFLNKFRLF